MNIEKDITIPTEEQQVVAIFKERLADFQKRLPGYASLSLQVTRHSSAAGSDDFEIEWGAYHNDSGHCGKEAGGSLTSAIAYHFSHEATKKRIAELREKAEQAAKEADALELACAGSI